MPETYLVIFNQHGEIKIEKGETMEQSLEALKGLRTEALRHYPNYPWETVGEVYEVLERKL